MKRALQYFALSAGVAIGLWAPSSSRAEVTCGNQSCQNEYCYIDEYGHYVCNDGTCEHEAEHHCAEGTGYCYSVWCPE